MTIREMRERALNIYTEARALVPTIAEDGNNAAEVDAQFDRMVAEADALEARAVRLEKLEERERKYSEIVTQVAESTVKAEGRSFTSNTDKAEHTFYEYLRGNITPHEFRAQSVGVASEGGFTVPTTFQATLIDALKAFGPMNDGGPVRYLNTASGNPIVMPTQDDTGNVGYIIAEGAQVSDASLAFGQLTLNSYKFTSGMFKVSSELLSDSALPISQIVNDSMAERIGRGLNKVFTTGTGSSQPQGIVTASSAGKTAASATAIAAAELMDLEHSIDPAYRGNAGYMFADSTLLALRKLVDSTGRPLWAASYQVGAPATFNDRPYWINNDMDAIATGKKSVLFGDFSKFTVRKAGAFVMKRLEERYADTDMTGFVSFIRVDSKLLDTRAVKALVQA